MNLNEFVQLLTSSPKMCQHHPQGLKELRRLLESLPPVNYNLLKYICRYGLFNERVLEKNNSTLSLANSSEFKIHDTYKYESDFEYLL